MRTPTAMILGLVLAPCGLLFTLTGTLAPGWRQLSGFLDKPVDTVMYQGLWTICLEGSSRERQCQVPDEWAYFSAAPVRAARALTVTSLVATLGGLLVATLGVRCWRDRPHWALAGVAGLLLAASGLLGLVPVAWYSHVLRDGAVLPLPPGPLTVGVGYSLVLGYLGSCLLILGGFSLALSLARCCEKCRRPSLRAPLPGPARGAAGGEAPGWPRAQPSANNAYSGRNHPLPVGRPGPADQKASRPKVGFRMPAPPRAYTNPLDVLDGEAVKGDGRGPDRRAPSSLPCDSDL
ncbi:claudin-23 [Ornithorhynchus anatinus]|uniref:Claudin 23 n=1 Tax=Ornithorhynchus anatinus TaxID=9258 RepID=A0A6I8P7Q8_ORNAN|nr:claudin-23 [Ornithorhynchus anatinus]